MKQSAPSVLLISLVDGGWAEACTSAGWRVTHADHAAETASRLAAVFAVAIAADSPGVAILRAHEHGATVPILGRVAEEGATVDPLLDEVAACPAAAVAALARWCPHRRAATLARLRQTFGADGIDALLAGFRRSLGEAIAGPVASADVAHRIAGIAGTLGFADVGAAWLRLAEGDGSAESAARRAASRAIAALGGG